MAAIEATPGTATLPRKNTPMEVVCRKKGYLEHRMKFAAAPARDVELEQGIVPRTPPAEAVGGAVLSALAAAFPPVMLVGLGFVGMDPPSAYRALPEFLLTPESFGSEAERDAFFVDLAARLEAAARAQRAYIDAHCRFWPCEPTDLACTDPVCERQRVLVDERLKTQLDEIPALRAKTRVLAQ